MPRLTDRVIACLLTEKTHAEAAQKAGIALATLTRWLRNRKFQRAYRSARRQIVEGAIGNLQQAAGLAVETLRRNLNCGKPGCEIRAAQVILESAIRAVEVLDLSERIGELERMAEGEKVP